LTGRKVDLVLEAAGQRFVVVEVKASANVTRGDFAGLLGLAEVLGTNFVRGVVLYTRDQLLPFADNLWAVPMGVLWS
jgi:hypothetical protein